MVVALRISDLYHARPFEQVRPYGSPRNAPRIVELNLHKFAESAALKKDEAITEGSGRMKAQVRKKTLQPTLRNSLHSSRFTSLVR